MNLSKQREIATKEHKLSGFKVTAFNGCRETDLGTMLENLHRADLSSLPAFTRWLKSLNGNRPFWKAIGWSEGYGYFHGANSKGQETYLQHLIFDRDTRWPELLKLETV